MAKQHITSGLERHSLIVKRFVAINTEWRKKKDINSPLNPADK